MIDSQTPCPKCGHIDKEGRRMHAVIDEHGRLKMFWCPNCDYVEMNDAWIKQEDNKNATD